MRLPRMTTRRWMIAVAFAGWGRITYCRQIEFGKLAKRYAVCERLFL